MLYITHQVTHYPPELKRALMAVDGYLTLGMPREAREELDAIEPAQQHASPVIRARIRILLHRRKWRAAEALALEGSHRYPDENEFMVQRAFALHQQERGDEAVKVLLNAPDWIRRTGILHYNLACYEAQLGDIGTARQCIRAAIRINKAFRRNAKKDPDLQRLWN